jgi:type II secretory ATPase GspE/PulE/Tfp pilus assembly ATPase PilB-like protein
MPPQLKHYQAALISRIKVMSGMNIAEKRLPQDGRINVASKARRSIFASPRCRPFMARSVSLRLLTRGKIFLNLEKLGFAPAEENAIREIIIKPHGIMLVTGPTGSGKSTSLYAFLSTINSVHKRIITIEEPVEYELKGINQIAVRPDIGLTFAMGLRHILRQDPNVIMVGEIRDLETAEIAIRARADRAPGVQHAAHERRAQRVHRLDRHGHRAVSGGFFGGSGAGAAAGPNDLPHCKVEQTVERNYLRKIGFPEAEIDTANSGAGQAVKSAGISVTRDAWVSYELLLLNEALRPLILNRAPASTIAQKAMEGGMRTLRADGWNKVRAGQTTIEEVLRVSQTEEHLNLVEETKPGVWVKE